MRRLIIVSLLSAMTALGQTEDGRTWLNQGIQAYRGAQYPDAIQAFQKVTALNPNDVNAHLYLGTTWMTMYIPGAVSPENLANAQNAEAEFRRVLELDPANNVALASLASLSFQQASGPELSEKLRKLDESASWYQKLASIDPQNKVAHYSLGVIAWSKVYPARMLARSRAGMRPEDPGPLSDLDQRQSLRAINGSVIEQGMRELETALQLDPNFADAMAYLNLLYRERADLSATREEWQRDTSTADQWVQKTLEAKKMNAQTDGGFARVPPPPPPSPGVAGVTGGLVSERGIRVAGSIQAANLISKVDPEYPPLAKQARIQGTVRFSAILGTDGHVENLQLISGHPLLVAAAQEAVKQWIYKPTLLNGNPVRVFTAIEVNFTLVN